MINFFIGLFVGTIIGIVVAAMLSSAKCGSCAVARMDYLAELKERGIE